MTYYEREVTIREWGYQTAPNEQRDGTIRPLINQFEPKIIAIGTDWLRKPYLEQIGLDVDYLEKKKIGLLFLPYTTTISTTDIKSRICRP